MLDHGCIHHPVYPAMLLKFNHSTKRNAFLIVVARTISQRSAGFFIGSMPKKFIIYQNNFMFTIVYMKVPVYL